MSPRISSSTDLSLKDPLHFQASAAAEAMAETAAADKAMETIAHSTSGRRGVLTTEPPRGILHPACPPSHAVPRRGTGLAVGPLWCARPIVELRALSERFRVVLSPRHG